MRRPLLRRFRRTGSRAALEAQLDAAIAIGRAAGEQVAPTVDADYGATRPAELWVVDRSGGARCAAVLPSFEATHAGNLARLCRRGPALIGARSESSSARRQDEDAAGALKQAASRLPGALLYHRYARHAGLARWAYLIALAVADLGLCRSVLELLGLDVPSTYMIASVVGLLQLVSCHLLGEMTARRGHRSKAADEAGGGEHEPALACRRRGLALLALAAPFLLVAVFMALVRADYLELQIAQAMGLAVTGIDVGYGLAVGLFASLQLALDAGAFLVGYAFGDPAVKEVGAAARAARRAKRRLRGARRRAARCEARFLGAHLKARQWCLGCIADVRQQWDVSRAQSAAVYGGATRTADPATAAVMSESVQLRAVDDEARGWRDETIKAIEERLAQLDRLAALWRAEPTEAPHASLHAGRAGGPASASPAPSQPIQ